MLGLAEYPITVVETATYQIDADKLFDGNEQDRLRDFLAFSPVAGDVIVGSGGVRRLLWTFAGKNKKREAQVLYFFRDLSIPVFLLAVYDDPKMEFDDEWREEMSKMAEALVNEYGRKRPSNAVPDSSA